MPKIYHTDFFSTYTQEDLPDKFSQKRFSNIYQQLFKEGNKFKGQSAPMSIYGSTMHPCQNRFNQKHNTFVPRQNVATKLGKASAMLKKECIISMVKLAESIATKHYQQHDPELLEHLTAFKKSPQEWRICDTMFTSMALVGDLSNGQNHFHRDKNDIVSVILMLGSNDVTGGRTMYFEDGEKNEMNPTHEEKMEHGKFQVGPFDIVNHLGTRWTNQRGIISFYIRRDVFQHFTMFGNKLFNMAIGESELSHRTDLTRTCNMKHVRTKNKKKRMNQKIAGGYILFNKHNKQERTMNYRSCVQDAVINASKELGRAVAKELIYKHCKPSLYEDTSLDKIIPCVKHLLKFTMDMVTFGNKIGGIEASLLRCRDKKIRIIISNLNNKTTKKTIYNHAFVHRASQLPGSKRKHIGALIDNREGEPVLLIQERDLLSHKTARSVYVKYLGGNANLELRITSIIKVELQPKL